MNGRFYLGCKRSVGGHNGEDCYLLPCTFNWPNESSGMSLLQNILLSPPLSVLHANITALGLSHVAQPNDAVLCEIDFDVVPPILDDTLIGRLPFSGVFGIKAEPAIRLTPAEYQAFCQQNKTAAAIAWGLSQPPGQLAVSVGNAVANMESRSDVLALAVDYSLTFAEAFRIGSRQALEAAEMLLGPGALSAYDNLQNSSSKIMGGIARGLQMITHLSGLEWVCERVIPSYAIEMAPAIRVGSVETIARALELGVRLSTQNLTLAVTFDKPEIFRLLAKHFASNLDHCHNPEGCIASIINSQRPEQFLDIGLDTGLLQPFAGDTLRQVMNRWTAPSIIQYFVQAFHKRELISEHDTLMAMSMAINEGCTAGIDALVATGISLTPEQFWFQYRPGNDDLEIELIDDQLEGIDNDFDHLVQGIAHFLQATGQTPATWLSVDEVLSSALDFEHPEYVARLKMLVSYVRLGRVPGPWLAEICVSTDVLQLLVRHHPDITQLLPHLTPPLQTAAMDAVVAPDM